MVNEYDGSFDKAGAVLKFYADWCAPCKVYAPVFENIANDHDGDRTFYAINVDAFPDMAKMHGVRSIPSVVVYDEDGSTWDSIDPHSLLEAV